MSCANKEIIIFLRVLEYYIFSTFCYLIFLFQSTEFCRKSFQGLKKNRYIINDNRVIRNTVSHLNCALISLILISVYTVVLKELLQLCNGPVKFKKKRSKLLKCFEQCSESARSLGEAVPKLELFVNQTK